MSGEVSCFWPLQLWPVGAQRATPWASGDRAVPAQDLVTGLPFAFPSDPLGGQGAAPLTALWWTSSASLSLWTVFNESGRVIYLICQHSKWLQWASGLWGAVGKCASKNKGRSPLPTLPEAQGLLAPGAEVASLGPTSPHACLRTSVLRPPPHPGFTWGLPQSRGGAWFLSRIRAIWLIYLLHPLQRRAAAEVWPRDRGFLVSL